MSKHDDKKRKGFREFYEEDDRKPNRKRVDESEKDKMKFRDKLKRIDPRDIDEEEFDDY